MKYYITYPGNTSMPWLTDSTVDIEADSEEEARRKFIGSGYKNIQNCIRIAANGEWANDRRHPMTAKWEDSIVKEEQFDQCQENSHWLQWVEKQHHPKNDVDQYGSFVPREHDAYWRYKMAIFCCTCGTIVHKEEGESGLPEQPMVNWYVIKYENYPGSIHGDE